MTQYLIIPGLGNSGPAHWQTWFEKTIPNCKRIEQKEWDSPALTDWLMAIDHAVAALDPSSVVLIGHSLGCSTIAHWAEHSGKIIKGAMLVAPSDIEAPAYTFPATGFTPIPLNKLPFKTIVVASNNDVWVSAERARYFANCWGSDYINIGDAGHINADAGFGPWEEGVSILKRL
jgi:predicted alpha/beta hydrolase family esterase